MITGTIQNWKQQQHFFHPAFATAFSFLAGNDLANFPVGRHPIAGDDIFAIFGTGCTKLAKEQPFEAHREHLDIQVVIKGQDEQGYYPLLAQDAGLKLLEDNLESKDLALYARPEKNPSVLLYPGLYAVYLPFELHSPMCAVNDKPEDIFKVIVKINKRCFK